MKKTNSLSGKIMRGFLVSFCLPLLVFLIAWSYQLNYIQRQAVLRQVDDNISSVVSEISYRVQELELSARSIATNPSVIEYLQKYDSDPTYYMLQAMGDFGSFLTNLNQINPRLETVRIWAANGRIPRYRNTIYTGQIMQGAPWMERAAALRQDEYFIPASALLYESQNEENYRQLVFPSSAENPRVFSLYRQIYAADGITPLGVLEVCMSTQELLGVAHTLPGGADLFFYEPENGIIFSYAHNAQREAAFAQWIQSDRREPFRFLGEEYDLQERTLALPSLTILYACPESLLHQTASLVLWPMLSALAVCCVLLVIFLRTSFRSVPLRLQTLIRRMELVRAGQMEIVFEDDQNDEISQVNQTLNQMLRHINDLINTVYRTELSEKEATLRFLRMQMDPHFLFNILEAIRMSLTLGYYDRVEDALVALSNILRARLRDNPHVTLQEELDITQEYVVVENLRYNDRIVLQTQVQDDGLLDEQIPCLSLQTLVNNSIRHGFRQDRPFLMIRVEVLRQLDGALLLRVTDDGAGMDEQRLNRLRLAIREGRVLDEQDAHGSGLVNLALRLRLNYGGNAQMQVESLPGQGTQVELVLRRSD